MSDFIEKSWKDIADTEYKLWKDTEKLLKMKESENRILKMEIERLKNQKEEKYLYVD